MTNKERWGSFIMELKNYIEEHHLCPPKHTNRISSMYNCYRLSQFWITIEETIHISQLKNCTFLCFVWF